MPHITQEATENCRSDRDYVSDSVNRLRTIERAIEDAQSNDNHLALSQACADFETADGHTGNSRSEQLLHGLCFKQTDMARSIADFSKGWRILLNLAHGKYLPQYPWG
jgi:ATP-binding cassette subfamily F protein 3